MSYSKSSSQSEMEKRIRYFHDSSITPSVDNKFDYGKFLENRKKKNTTSRENRSNKKQFESPTVASCKNRTKITAYFKAEK